jgi:hypothetical protein
MLRKLARRGFDTSVAVALCLAMVGCVTQRGKDTARPLWDGYVTDLFTPALTPEAKAAKEQRLAERQQELWDIKRKEQKYGLRSQKRLEREAEKAGNSLDAPVLKIVSVEAEPATVVPGASTTITCLYEAYGGGLETSPTATIGILSDGEKLVEFPFTGKLYPGRDLLVAHQELPPRLPAGNYDILVKMSHGAAEAETSTSFQVLPAEAYSSNTNLPNPTPTQTYKGPREAYHAYVQQMIEAVPLESQASDAYARARAKKGLSMVNAFESTTLPAFRAYQSALEGVACGSDEVQEVHKTLINAARKRTAGLEQIIRGAKRLNEAEVMAGNDMILEGERLTQQWTADFGRLNAKYN